MDIILIAVLLAFSAIFSATETAFSSANRIRIKSKASQGNKNAVCALKIIDKFDNALTAILICNNVVNIASASLMTVIVTRKLGAGSVGIATAVMTVLVLVFGEILPKSLAKENAESFSLFIARGLSVLTIILTPLIFIFACLKKGVAKILKSGNSQPSVTEEELISIIDEIEDEGVLEEQESDLVRSALEFDEIKISEILIPRVNIFGIEENQPIEEIRTAFLENRFSRLPVFRESMDNIIGIIHEKDFFSMYFGNSADISTIIQKPIYISEHKLISEIMHEMQRTKVHMAIVLDQYGGTEGIVTLEDIIEELVGEIYDENDEAEAMFVKVGESSYEISGEINIWDFLEQLELPDDIIETECTSIGGWLMDLLGHIPENNESISDGIFTLTAIEVDDTKIERVRVDISADTPTEEKE